MQQEILDVAELKNKVRQFIAERGWQSFQSPKNVAMCLSVESAELLEIFQWLTEEESFAIKHTDQYEHVKQELADVVFNAVSLCLLLDINLPEAIENKLKLNQQRYPVVGEVPT